MEWTVIDIHHRTVLHDRTRIDDGHPVGHRCHGPHVMGDEQHPHCSLGAHVVDQVEDCSPDRDVESGERFVGDEHARGGQQRRCEPAPLR